MALTGCLSLKILFVGCLTQQRYRSISLGGRASNYQYGGRGFGPELVRLHSFCKNILYLVGLFQVRKWPDAGIWKEWVMAHGNMVRIIYRRYIPEILWKTQQTKLNKTKTNSASFFTLQSMLNSRTIHPSLVHRHL